MSSQQIEDIQESGMDRKGIDIPIGIGEDTQIRKAIVDKSARIGKNVLVCKILETINTSFAREGRLEWSTCLINIPRSVVRVLTQPIPDSYGRSCGPASKDSPS